MKLYRSRQGKIFGVCQGLEDRTGYPARYFRAALIVAAFFTLWWTVAVYLAAALILPVKRPEGYESEGFKETFEDLKDDAFECIHREYRDFRAAGHSSKREEADEMRNRPV